MKTLKDFMTEAMTSPVAISWNNKTDNSWVGDFIVNKVRYQIELSVGNGTPDGFTLWEIAFSKIKVDKFGDDYDVYNIDSGDGGGLQVFSTVIKAVNDHRASVPNVAYEFTAHSIEPSRVKLYNRATTTFANKNNLELRIKKHHQYVYYTMLPKV